MRRRLAVIVACALASLLAMPPAVLASPDTWGANVRLEVQAADVSAGRTTYALLGPPSARPLLLLNGTGSPMAQWDPALLAGLSRDRSVLVYDYPGLGGSSALPGRLTFDALADHAAGLMDAVGIARADVLGWSMGGFVAQRLAVRHPERVNALILAATNPGGPATTLGPVWVQEQDSDPEGSLRGYVRSNYPPGHRDRGWAFVRRVEAAIGSGRYPPDRVPASVYEAMVSAEDPWLDSSANLRALRDLEVPTLVVTGREDVVTPPDNSRLLARTIPDAGLLLVPESGHSFLFQQPARSAALVSTFLDARRLHLGRSARPSTTAEDALGRLPVKGRAPLTGYSREAFGTPWTDVDGNGCDTRNDILRRDLTRKRIEPDCTVARGMLDDPYTRKQISHVAGRSAIDIDHVVSLSDAWQKGAFRWTERQRTVFANDPLNLLAVDYSANRQKGDGDAATWLPPNKAYRCAFVARQVAVKSRYQLWVTAAERAAIARVLSSCPGYPLPVR